MGYVLYKLNEKINVVLKTLIVNEEACMKFNRLVRLMCNMIRQLCSPAMCTK